MTDEERRLMKLRAARGKIEPKVDRAQSLVSQWLSKTEKPYVAFSGGKDSTVLLDLVRREAEVTALFGDDEHLLPGTEEMLAATDEVTRVCGPTSHCDWYTSWEGAAPEDAPEGAAWIDSDPQRGCVLSYARREGYDGVAIGLRSAESGVRAVHHKSHGRLYYAEAKGLWQCFPIADWTARDVWTYVVQRGLSYHSAYDVMAQKDTPMGERRVGPFAPAHATGTTLRKIRQCFPDAFRSFARKYPEATRYV